MTRTIIVLVLVGIVAFFALMTTIVVAGAIWPGEAKLTAPLFCPDDKPDAFVVVDRYHPGPGETAYDFSLYCMGPRGQTEEIGWFRPSAVLTLVHALLLVAGVGGLVLLVRRRSRGRPPRPGAGAATPAVAQAAPMSGPSSGGLSDEVSDGT
ncbi:MAG TPA: hypothetical protein VH479_20300 [Acidimicrobiales bacterium]